MRTIADAELRPAAFDDLPGWGEADLTPVWTALHDHAAAALNGATPLRSARIAEPALVELWHQITQQPKRMSASDVRAAFAQRFAPMRIEGPGFLTGYYEPVIDGALTRSAEFTAPVLPRPPDLVSFPLGVSDPRLPGFAAGRRMPDGSLEPYADREALEDWAEGPDARPIVWLRDWTEVFLVQVQGSARVRLTDGSQRRLVYAGRNGHPYTSIGRLLVEGGEIALADMSLDRLKTWLRAHGQEPGGVARRLMQRNRSYIFFALNDDQAEVGPTGGAGLPLTPGVSIAVDRTLWSYGLPFWIEADGAVPGFGPKPLARLFLAQDTGTAIVGPARADLFLGSGEDAGRNAGSIRHPARFTVFCPKAS